MEVVSFSVYCSYVSVQYQLKIQYSISTVFAMVKSKSCLQTLIGPRFQPCYSFFSIQGLLQVPPFVWPLHFLQMVMFVQLLLELKSGIFLFPKVFDLACFTHSKELDQVVHLVVSCSQSPTVSSLNLPHHQLVKDYTGPISPIRKPTTLSNLIFFVLPLLSFYIYFLVLSQPYHLPRTVSSSCLLSILLLVLSQFIWLEIKWEVEELACNYSRIK